MAAGSRPEKHCTQVLSFFSLFSERKKARAPGWGTTGRFRARPWREKKIALQRHAAFGPIRWLCRRAGPSGRMKSRFKDRRFLFSGIAGQDKGQPSLPAFFQHVQKLSRDCGGNLRAGKFQILHFPIPVPDDLLQPGYRRIPNIGRQIWNGQGFIVYAKHGILLNRRQIPLPRGCRAFFSLLCPFVLNGKTGSVFVQG
jgi:hypothetical protein